MTTIVTRAGKESPLENSEVDSNFTNLNTDKVEKSGDSMTGNLSFGDNDKAIFGAGSDLQIYHDGSHSWIHDSGTGNLKLRAEDFQVVNSGNTQAMIYGDSGGAVTLYYTGSPKLATTSTGIDVTGTVTADGLTVDGGTTDTAADFRSTDTSALIRFTDSGGSTYAGTTYQNGNGAFALYTGGDTSGAGTHKSLAVEGNGDISFYEDTGTTAKFFWDASQECLSLNTTSPAKRLSGNVLTINESGGNSSGLEINVSGSSAGELFSNSSSTVLNEYRAMPLVFRTSNTERMRITSGGNVGIGTSSPSAKLHVEGNSAVIKLLESGGSEMRMAVTGSASYLGTYVADPLIFTTNSIERMRIDNSGNVGIGTSSPSAGLHILSDVNPVMKLDRGSANTTNANLYYNGTLTGQLSAANADFQISAAGASTPISFYANGSERMRITSSGNVGIGTSSPASELDVFHSTDPEIRLTISTHGDAGVLLGDADGLKIYGKGYSNQLRFYTGTTERMRIDSSGNVGIGTSSPSSWSSARAVVNGGYLGVSNTTEARMYLYTGTTPRGLFYVDTSRVQLEAIGSNPLTFWTGNSESARIDSSGNLLVGTTSVGTKSGDTVIGFGPNGGIISKQNLSVANNGTVDIAINTGGGGYQGFLIVSNTLSGNAAIRTHRTYSVFGRGTDSSIQQIATDNGATGGCAFTVTTPSNGVIRVTNTSGSTSAVNIQFFGGVSG